MVVVLNNVSFDDSLNGDNLSRKNKQKKKLQPETHISTKYLQFGKQGSTCINADWRNYLKDSVLLGLCTDFGH